MAVASALEPAEAMNRGRLEAPARTEDPYGETAEAREEALCQATGKTPEELRAAFAAGPVRMRFRVRVNGDAGGLTPVGVDPVPEDMVSRRNRRGKKKRQPPP